MRNSRAAQLSGSQTHLARAAQEMELHALEAAELLKALANEQRLMILCNLVEGPLSVSQLNERIELSQSALSQHLAVLREAGVVRTERESQSVRYSLPAGVVTRLLEVLHAEYCGAGRGKARDGQAVVAPACPPRAPRRR